MEYVLYCYVPKIKREQIITLLDTLRVHGVSLTHLGKSDPPKKWAGDDNAIVDLILQGKDGSNYTFLRDKKKKFELDIWMHMNDERWGHDTLSASSADLDFTKAIGLGLFQSLNPYIVFLGDLGKGKDQDWNVLGVSKECPKDILLKIKGAEPPPRP